MRRQHNSHRLYVLFFLSMFLAGEMIMLAGCTVGVNPVTGRRRVLGYTWQQEVQIGREADQQIVQQFGVYDDPALAAYVDRIGQRVLQESHMRRPETPEEMRQSPFTFRVLDSPVINAFALPGGYIYLTRGLLAHLNNEAQMAVVLGHEVTHVAARHASQRAALGQAGQLLVLGGAILGQELLGLPGQTLLDVGGAAAQLLFLSYSREDEREADARGVEYSARANYRAHEGSEFFVTLQRLGERDEGTLPTFLATHPDPGQREVTIVRLAEEYAQQLPMNIVGTDEFLNTLSGTVMGEDPRQGFVEGNVFYHPELRFQFPVPSGWRVANQPTQVALLEPNQRAAMLFEIAQGQNARAAAQALVRQEGVRVVRDGATTVGGFPAYWVVVELQGQQGNTGALVYFIEHGGRVYQFAGITAAQTYGTYEPTFLNTIRGYAEVTNPQILAVQPARVQVVPANRTAPFSAFVPSRLPYRMTAEELAIMNQVTLDETIPQGTRLKLPVF